MEEDNKHQAILKDCRVLTLSGVTAVDSSEDRRVRLKTVCGYLTVEGKGLRMLNLDLNSGNAAVGGKINALFYAEADTATKAFGLRRKGKR